MRISKLVSQGELLPRFYGIAYCNFLNNTAVCFPIPLNLIVRLFCNLYFKLLCTVSLDYKARLQQETTLQKAILQSMGYTSGYNLGYETGYKLGFTDGQESAKQYVQQLHDEFLKRSINQDAFYD